METITTIKLSKKTKSRLDKLKIVKRESYDETINKIINILNICKLDPYQAKFRLKEIDKIKNINDTSQKSSQQSQDLQHNHPQE